MYKVLYRIFPFVPLIFGIASLLFYHFSGGYDAQDAIFFLFVLILGLLGNLVFTVIGLVYLAAKQAELRYYRKVFRIFMVINIFTLVFSVLYGIWMAVFILAIMATGIITLRRYDKAQKGISS